MECETGNIEESSDKQIENIENKNQKEDTGKEKNDTNKEEAAQRGPRSWVWEHFPFVKGVTTTECRYCKRKIKCNPKVNGTGGLGSHLSHHCPTSPIYTGKRGKVELYLKKQSVLSYKPIVKGENLSNELALHSFDQEKCRISLARMCIKDNRSFNVVDDEGYRDHVLELCPLFKFLSRWTVGRDCLTIYKDEAMILKKILRDHTVSLTTDTWSSVQNINYMCLTAHWIDENWALRKAILNFCPISNHKGETIGKLVYACLQNWGIERVFTVTVDNASSNDGVIKYLKTMLRGPDAILDCKFIHLRCCAHVLNLVVRDGLEEQNESVVKIRNAVRYVRSSPAREATFRECVDRENSTYLMLVTSDKYAGAFKRLQSIDYNFKAYFGGGDEDEQETNTRKRMRQERYLGPPEDNDWLKVRQLIQYLKLFYNVTNLISGSKYFTSSSFFNELVAMQATISKMCLSVDVEERKMAISMKAKYDKYWDNLDNMNFLLYVVGVLDPCNRMCYLVFCLGQAYGTNTKKTKEVCDHVLLTLDELFYYYKKKADKVNIKGSSSPSFIFSDVKTNDIKAKGRLKSR